MSDLPRHNPGDQVRLVHDDHAEYGVVVRTWLDEHGDQDCYVAFFGTEPPGEGKPEKPYVLRYMAASLSPGWNTRQ